MDKEIKMLRFYMPQGWDDSECMLEVNGKRYNIKGKLIPGHWEPLGKIYYKIDDNDPMSQEWIYQDFKMSDGNGANNIVLEIGLIATISRILQGYEIENTGNYFNTFINDNGVKQAIVYPYVEMEWENFKYTDEAYREEKKFFESVEKELIEKGFVKNENEFWIKS